MISAARLRALRIADVRRRVESRRAMIAARWAHVGGPFGWIEAMGTGTAMTYDEWESARADAEPKVKAVLASLNARLARIDRVGGAT